MTKQTSTKARREGRLTRTARILAAIALSVPVFAAAADLELAVAPLASASGSLMVAVYGSGATFRKEAVQQQKIAASTGSMTVRFSNLAPGDYAVALFHDTNDNGKLDSNLFGVPTEPYGFSKLERSLMGPPAWDEVRFLVPADGARLNITLR